MQKATRAGNPYEARRRKRECARARRRRDLLVRALGIWAASIPAMALVFMFPVAVANGLYPLDAREWFLVASALIASSIVPAILDYREKVR